MFFQWMSLKYVNLGKCICFNLLFIYSNVNPFLINAGIEPLSSDKEIIALENMATNVGSKRIPNIVPNVAEPMIIRYWVPTNSNVFSVGAVSIRLPVKGCCIIFAMREIMTIELNKDKPEARSFTLAPESLTAYARVSIE